MHYSNHHILTCYVEQYQPYVTFVEEGFQPQQSFMLYNVISVILLGASKAADKFRHVKVLDIMVIT